MLFLRLRRQKLGQLPVVEFLEPHRCLGARELALHYGVSLVPPVGEEVHVLHEPVPVLLADARARAEAVPAFLEPRDELVDGAEDILDVGHELRMVFRRAL